MRFPPAAALVLLCALVAPVPAAAAPSHAESGAIVGLHRGDAGAEAAAVKGLNAGWMSIYAGWADLETAKGQFNTGLVPQYHDRLDAAKAAGLKVNVTFIGTPGWASGHPEDTNYPPTNPRDFGDFVTWFASTFGDKVDAYELGNEPNGVDFWRSGPNPRQYAAFAAEGIRGAAADPDGALKFIGATAGADDEFMEQVLATGITGWDAIAFHSGTACKIESPDAYIRQAQGDPDIHGNSYTGYRELIHMMRSRGIADPKVADTGSGWSTTTAVCDRGASKGQKPGGVSEAQQSQFLRDSFGCAEFDTELKWIFIFSLYDYADDGVWDHEMGLIKTDGTKKRSYGELAGVLGGAPGNPKPPFSGGYCGGYVDHKPPTVTLTTKAPVVGGVPIYADQPLELAAKGTDEHPVTDIDLFADGKEIATTTKEGAVSMSWFGARQLPLGEHTITAVARDEAGNVSEKAALKVKKVDPRKLAPIATRLRAKAKVRSGRRVTIRGALTWPATIVKPSGQIRVWFKQGRFVSKYNATRAGKGRFNRTFKLRRKGKWTVSVFYEGAKPFKRSRAKRLTVRVR